MYDVIVLGLGGMGSAAAYHMAKRGVRVLGLEQFGIAHDQGASHGRTRMIRQAYFQGPDYVPLLRRAYDLWYMLEHETSATLLTITGAIYVGLPDAPIVDGAIQTARRYQIPHEIFGEDEIRRRYPVLRPRAEHLAVLDSMAGILVPELCVGAHLEMAQHHGADLHFNERVESWRADARSVSVQTTHSTYEAGTLVITAGPWAGHILKDLALPLEVERHVLYWFEPRAHPEAFKRLPVWAWEDHDTQLYGFPYLDGQGLKCAFLHRIFGEPTTPQTVRRGVGEDEKERMRQYLARVMPDATGPVLATSTCMYTNTPDGHFIIDHHPAHTNVVLACGFSGHGFKFCSVIGEVLADLALRGKTVHPIGLFALERFRSPIP